MNTRHISEFAFNTAPQPPPQARKYCTAGPNTGPGLPHPTGHEPTRQVHTLL